MRKFGFIKKLSLLLASAVMVQAAVAPLSSRQANAEEAAPALNLEVKSAILMEATTGQVLYENNADVALPPASMAKMMTEYLVMEAIKSGKIKWTDMVPVSERAAKVGGSGQMLGVGQQYTVEKIFQELSIYSGNDGAVALAEFVGGSEDNFAKMMNAKAKELGMSANAHFISATGLSRKDLKEPPAEDGETLMTARDAATLAYNILKDDKDTILKFTKIPAIKFRDTDKDPMINWNWMLEGNSSNPNFKKYAYPGLDGLKTGSTDDAGYCFTATAERNGMRLISVVMGTKSEPKRFEETRKVLDYGFNNFEFKKVLDAGKQVDQLKTVAIKKGIGKEVPVETKDSVTFVVKKGTKDDEIKLAASPIEEAKLVAPIQKGQKLGTLKISYGTQEKTVDLVASQDMQKASWIRLLFRAIGGLFADLFGSMKKAL